MSVIDENILFHYSDRTQLGRCGESRYQVTPKDGKNVSELEGVDASISQLKLKLSRAAPSSYLPALGGGSERKTQSRTKYTEHYVIHELGKARDLGESGFSSAQSFPSQGFQRDRWRGHSSSQAHICFTRWQCWAWDVQVMFVCTNTFVLLFPYQNTGYKGGGRQRSKLGINWRKSQVMEEFPLENEIEHSYKIHGDTELKELIILQSPRLELRLILKSGGKGPKSIIKNSVKRKILPTGINNGDN